MYLALRLAHLMSTAIWFGATLTTAGDVRRSLDQGPVVARAMVPRVRQSLWISSGASLLALGTGLGLMLLLGGFRALPVRFHLGFGLALAAVAIETSALSSAFGRVAAAVRRDKEDEARAGARLVTWITGGLHLIRAAIFLLMVLRF